MLLNYGDWQANAYPDSEAAKDKERESNCSFFLWQLWSSCERRLSPQKSRSQPECFSDDLILPLQTLALRGFQPRCYDLTIFKPLFYPGKEGRLFGSVFNVLLWLKELLRTENAEQLQEFGKFTDSLEYQKWVKHQGLWSAKSAVADAAFSAIFSIADSPDYGPIVQPGREVAAAPPVHGVPFDGGSVEQISENTPKSRPQKSHKKLSPAESAALDTKIHNLNETGMSVREIARALKISHSSVYERLSKNRPV